LQRREWLKRCGAAACMTGLWPAFAAAGERHDFVPAQLLAPGQEKAPHPSALRSMMKQLINRTSIDAATERATVRITGSGEFFRYPFQYLAGRSEFKDLTDEETGRLRSLLDAGGLLFVDDASGVEGSDFDRWFRRQAKKLYPRRELKSLPEEHTLFRSYYLLDRIGGRVLIRDGVEGITVGDRSPVIYCINDVGGAWATDLFGRPLNDCQPGGERQREMAWRLGVNLVMYALCLNYKKDRVHVEAILERRKLR